MDNKLKPLLIKSILARRHQEKGSILPMALGIGLIMVLLAIAMVFRSKDDQVGSSLQKQTAESQTIAEAGIQRTLALLNSPANILYLISNLQDTDNDGIADTWSDATDGDGAVVEIYSPCADTDNLPVDFTLPQAIDEDGRKIYRVVSYNFVSTYTTDDPAPAGFQNTDKYGGTGTLTVRGTLYDQEYNDDYVDKNGDEINPSIGAASTANKLSETELTITIETRSQTTPDSFPGLYAGSIIDLGGNDVKGDPDTANIICANKWADSTCDAPDTYCEDPYSTAGQEAAAAAIGANSQSTVSGNILLGDVNLPPAKIIDDVPEAKRNSFP